MDRGGEPDLLSLVAVAGMAVPVEAAAVALTTTPQQIISVGTSLVNAGKLRETPAGYLLVTGVTPEVTPAVATYLAGHLADALAAGQADPRQVGRLLVAAGRFAGAWRVLSAAALDGSSRYSDSEQVELLQKALDALGQANLDGGENEGRLQLRLARLYRNRGQTADAYASLEVAIPRLSGEDLVDALGFAASVEDDLQHPQEAERWVALAELAATRVNSPAKLGSLLTFHGRELSRLGFAEEAAATVVKGQKLLERHGTEVQRFYGRLNQAWIDLDQGQMRNAEIGFARLRDEAATKEGEASQADKEAYWARALFGVGRPVEALAAIERARALADKVGAFAPVFISQLAAAEGGLLFEQWDLASEASDRALETALASLPSWENVCRYLRARALAGLGSVDEARAEVEAGLAATPSGSNGLRWRLRLEELQLELSDTWPQSRAEDLTDQFLQSRWLGAAADLMTMRGRREKNPELAAEAAALAMQLGNPVQAAKAIAAGDLWGDPLALPVRAAIRHVAARLPSGWTIGVLDSPEAQAALSEPVAVGEPELELLRSKIDQALAAAGLSGELVLSPAQRRAKGLVRRTRPRRSPWRSVGAVAGVVAIAVLASFAVVGLTTPPPTTTTLTTTTTTVVEMEDMEVAAPEIGIFGTTQFRGDLGRSGVGAGGIGEATGHYWRNPLGPIIVRPPIAHGLYLLVPNDENIIQVIQQRSGVVEEEIQTEGVGSLLASGEGGEAGTIVLFVSDSGTLFAHSAFRGDQLWDQDVGEVVTAPLIVGDSVYVATTDGRLLSFSLAGGQPKWAPYPEGEPAGPFRTAPAFDGDTIYLASDDGFIHAVDINTGLAACEPIDTRFEIQTNPMIMGDTLFMGTLGGSVNVYSTETCWGLPSNYNSNYPVPTEDGAIVTPDALYWVEGLVLHGVGLAPDGWTDPLSTPFLWTSFTDDSLITTPPVLANGLIYIGTGSGNVYAINAETGEEAWRYRTGSSRIRHELLVVDGAVFTTTADGRIIAIAGE